MKAAEEGENREGGRIGDERCGRGTGRTVNTKIKRNQVTQFSFKKNTIVFVYSRPFYRK